MRRFLFPALLALPLAVATAACDDGIGLSDPLIARDTSMIIAAPTASATLPSAIDFSQLALRRPEQLQDASQWDFTLRQEGETLRFVPNPFDIASRHPLILKSTEAFADIERAPTARSAYGDTAIVLQEGGVYVMRSRQYPTSAGTFCYSYSKMEVVDLDPEAGTAELNVKANFGCVDDRLEPE